MVSLEKKPLHYDSGKTPMASARSGTEYRRLFDQYVQQRRSTGLCYRCDEKYSPGHKCKKEVSVLLVQTMKSMKTNKKEMVNMERQMPWKLVKT